MSKKKEPFTVDIEHNKLAIVACYYTAIDAPYEDPGFTIWTLNQKTKVSEGKRIDAYFDLHDWATANYTADYVEDIPWDTAGEVITTESYPYAEVFARYGYFWENSIPLMLGLAGYRDFKSIYLFGCEAQEFIDTPKMGWSLFHVIGALRREGRKVFFANEYAMDYSGIYGFKDMQKTQIPRRGFKFK